MENVSSMLKVLYLISTTTESCGIFLFKKAVINKGTVLVRVL